MDGEDIDIDRPSSDDDAFRFPDANIVAVKALAGVFSSVLGPSSKDKLIIEQLESRTPPRPLRGPEPDKYVVTSDGHTIMDTVSIEHPVGAILGQISGSDQPGEADVEGAHIPDGVSSTVVLLGSLLHEGQSRLDLGLHPHTIRSGYEIGAMIAHETLHSLTRQVGEAPDAERWKRSVARTAITGNDIAGMGETWADLAVEAVETVGPPNELSLAVRTLMHGSITESRLVRGAVLDRNQRAHEDMPRRVTDPTIAVLGGFEHQGGLQDPQIRDDIALDIHSPTTTEKVEAMFVERREQIVSDLVEKEVDVVVARSGISPEFQRCLADNGILGIRGVSELEVRQVAAATGARLCKHPEDLDPEGFGTCGLVEEQIIDKRQNRRTRRRMIVFEDCDEPKSVTVLLRGVSGQIADQATIQLRKAAMAVAEAMGLTPGPAGVVPGGGAADLHIAETVRDRATSYDSRVQLALEAFADASENLLATIARNGAVDPYTAVTTVRSRRMQRDEHFGIFLPEGSVVNTEQVGIVDPTATRCRVYTTAVEVANLILNIDDAIDAVVSQEPPDPDDAIYEEPAEEQREFQQEADT